MVLFFKAFIAFIIFFSPLSAAEIFLKENIEGQQKVLKIKASGQVCLRTDERKEGRSKICYYDCSGRSEVLKVDGNKICPAAIER